MSIEETAERPQSEDERRRARHEAHLAERRAIGARARAEARLQEAFERDLIGLDALEIRLAQVNKARTPDAIDAALVDIPALAEIVEADAQSEAEAPAAAPSTALAVGEVPRAAWAIGVLGGSVRKGQWTVPRRLRAVALLGGCELDFTQARFGPETDVHCVSVMGGVEIKVPPGVRVESNGIGILGGFENTSDGGPRPGQPVLRVHGVALMGGVEIKTVDPDR